MSKGDDDHGLYLFKTIGFDAAKGKFDTKGFPLTCSSDAKQDDDVINKKRLDSFSDEIKNKMRAMEGIQTLLRTNLADLDTKLKSIQTLNSEDAKVSTHIVPMLADINYLKTSMLKEVKYEVMVKKNSNHKFPTPLRLLDSTFHKHSLSTINIYDKIELLYIGTEIKFLNSKNNEIHNQKYKGRKNLKSTISITINKEKDKLVAGDKPLYTYTFAKMKTHARVSPIINLDNKFQDRIVIKPDSIDTCFVTESEEAKFKTTRVITNDIENIKINILFLLRLTYNFDTQEEEVKMVRNN